MLLRSRLDVALFGIFSAYMKNLQLPSQKSGINTEEWSSEHSKGPACPSRSWPFPPTPTQQPIFTPVRCLKVCVSLLQWTDLECSPFFMRNTGLRLSSSSLQGQFFLSTQDFPQMSLRPQAFPDLTIYTMQSLYSVLTYPLYLPLLEMTFFVHNQSPSQV